MIGWFLAGALSLLLGLALINAFVGASPKAAVVWLRRVGAGALAIIAVYLMVVRRLDLAFLSGSAALILLGRWPAGWAAPWSRWASPAGFRNAGGGSPGQSSEVSTEFLRMTLDHETGETSGLVLKGQFAGRRLEELDRDEVLALLRECRLQDTETATLIEAYLDRTAGDGWRAHEAGQGGAGASPPKTAMAPDEARAILGVGPNATADEIRAAYHRLMKKLHPDQGGSTYLASQINAAKSALLGE